MVGSRAATQPSLISHNQKGVIMYDGTNDIEDEVKQNVRDQQHPDKVVFPTSMHYKLSDTQPMPALSAGPKKHFGLSQRQNDLINNVDVGQPEQGAARKRRMDGIVIEIDYMEKLLPNVKKVCSYLASMPVEDDVDLAEAKRLSISKLKTFLTHISSKLETLQLELDIKRSEV